MTRFTCSSIYSPKRFLVLHSVSIFRRASKSKYYSQNKYVLYDGEDNWSLGGVCFVTRASYRNANFRLGTFPMFSESENHLDALKVFWSPINLSAIEATFTSEDLKNYWNRSYLCELGVNFGSRTIWVIWSGTVSVISIDLHGLRWREKNCYGWVVGWPDGILTNRFRCTLVHPYERCTSQRLNLYDDGWTLSCPVFSRERAQYETFWPFSDYLLELRV